MTLDKNYRPHILNLCPWLFALDGQRRRQEFVDLSCALTDEGEIDLPVVGKLYDAFDLKTEHFRDDTLDELLQDDLKSFQKSADQCHRAADRLDQACREQQRRLQK